MAASKQFSTQGIVLARTDYREADRIITFLTPSHGKLRAIAKAVRKSQSKLAGGIELFSVSNISLVQGRGEIYTLTGSRLDKHYGQIVKDLERTNLAYELIKLINKATDLNPESGYFDVLHQVFTALNDSEIDPKITELWCQLRVLDLAGHNPDLQHNQGGDKLPPAKAYNFDFEQMCFAPAERGRYQIDDIKFLRLAQRSAHPQNLARISAAKQLAAKAASLIESILKPYIRI